MCLISFVVVSLLDEGDEVPVKEEAVDAEKPVVVKTRIKKVSPGVYTSEVSTCGWTKSLSS